VPWQAPLASEKEYHAVTEAERRRRKNARRWCRRKHSLKDAMCVLCQYVTAQERHHRDGDVTNNTATNVELVCAACHDRVHTGERWYADRDPARWVSNGGCGAILPFTVAK
jgi:hypothetical protein